jgi:hypothetical protein
MVVDHMSTEIVTNLEDLLLSRQVGKAALANTIEDLFLAYEFGPAPSTDAPEDFDPTVGLRAAPTAEDVFDLGALFESMTAPRPLLPLASSSIPVKTDHATSTHRRRTRMVGAVCSAAAALLFAVALVASTGHPTAPNVTAAQGSPSGGPHAGTGTATAPATGNGPGAVGGTSSAEAITPVTSAASAGSSGPTSQLADLPGVGTGSGGNAAGGTASATPAPAPAPSTSAPVSTGPGTTTTPTPVPTPPGTTAVLATVDAALGQVASLVIQTVTTVAAATSPLGTLA